MCNSEKCASHLFGSNVKRCMVTVLKFSHFKHSIFFLLYLSTIVAKYMCSRTVQKTAKTFLQASEYSPNLLPVFKYIKLNLSVFDSIPIGRLISRNIMCHVSIPNAIDTEEIDIVVRSHQLENEWRAKYELWLHVTAWSASVAVADWICSACYTPGVRWSAYHRRKR